jgi:membrane-associated phospholipid phosphatase
MKLGRLGHWVVALAATAVAVAIAYQWLDRPIAFFVHDNLRQFIIFQHLTLIPEWFKPVAVLVFAVLGIRGLTGRPLTRFEAVILMSGVSLVVAVAIKDQLKYIFGRTWPETWIQNNPSLIRDGVYGFNPFHGGRGWESFPSGHMAAVCAVMSVLWICYPRFRLVYALVVVAVAIGLIGTDFHFLSDIIAGAFIGISTGWIAISLSEAGGAPCRPVPSAAPPMDRSPLRRQCEPITM